MILIPHGTLSEIGCILKLYMHLQKKLFFLFLDFAKKPE